ncbi:hypothetical protein EJ02DRAFT_467678 [Clathrospora elynae]|uniref:Zn(2)-C6 fungal-type domain-containing protein n=1 Tax=Clathrospora elynae TaxID=706981 RepID=A0A6A5SJL2_9PLEO|nr:hypothetical protein EJ02DRAFT_467678 [Clathrospora elynae]
MSSASDYQPELESPKPPLCRLTPRPPTPTRPLTPRKRRRLASGLHRHDDRYNDAYRVLFNADVSRAAARFEADGGGYEHYTAQIGASSWSPKEQAALFGALARLGRDDLPGIAGAIGTKSIPETQELLLLLHDAATRQGDVKLTLRDMPAAIEVSHACNEQLDMAAEALAWFQESFEASEEKERYGDRWLITTAVAEQIEDALDPSPSRVTTPVPVPEPEFRRRGGRVAVGACTSCKKFKRKCDRGTPCANCVRRSKHSPTECVYPEEPARLAPRGQANGPAQNDPILEAIPEAILLDPWIMLRLSRTVFMNRSPAIPSPWLHWSEYPSDHTKEPAIYRTAFNDLHTLVVSVTKRLVQTAITQATSRLRSQRKRTTKAVLPMLRRRDVFAAIDIVGMKRNGRERWRGVARRCALHVYESRWSRPKGTNTKVDVPWDEVEQILASNEPSIEVPTTDVETSGDDTWKFKSRAVRSGTPLPMEQLAISDSVSDTDSNPNMEVDSDDSLLEESRPLSKHPGPRSRDPIGRYTSESPTTTDAESRLSTLEQFDQEACRQEEEALWAMLELEPPVGAERVKSDEDIEQSHLEESEKVITHPDGWRSWTDYHAEWEEFRTQVPIAKFIANQKPRNTISAVQARSSNSTSSHSGNETDSSTQNPTHRSKRKAPQVAELQAQGTNAYAILQGLALNPMGTMEKTSDHDDSENVSSDVDRDQPMQSMGEISDRGSILSYSSDGRDLPTLSIEAGNRRAPVDTSDEEMDWDAYID